MTVWGSFFVTFYKLLLTVHIFSAILGLGPGFVMIYIVTNAKTLPQLKHAYEIRRRIHLFVMVGGTLLLVTGLWMGYLNRALFQQTWYIASFILYMAALGAGPFILSPKSKPIKEILAHAEGEEIPANYEPLAKDLFFYERITNVLFLIIIVLMILKPF